MGAFSNYLENAIVESVLRNGTALSVANVYVGLYESDPTEATPGGTETSYTGYTRQAATWTPIDTNTGQTSNSNALTFPANGNASAAVTITHIVLFDNSVVGAGNRLFYAALAAPKTLSPGDTLSFAVGAIVFGID